MTGAARTASARFDHHRGAMPLLRQTRAFRGTFFVAANLVGFVAVNAFLHYLATGRWLDFSIAGYRWALVTPLGRMLSQPLSIFAHPWMIPVAGLLVGAVVFVPIAAAVLYRLWVSGLFVAAVAVVGHAPLLACALALGCVLAGRTRMRSSLPFLALLAGLVPVVAYLSFFARGGDLMLAPLRRVVFLLPFILALVAAVLAGGVVLALARLTRFRPGVIWPVLLVFLAAPVGLFYLKVGPAELDYALLHRRFEARDSVFSYGPVARLAASAPTSAPARGPGGQGPAEAERRLERCRAELMIRCRRFLKTHPASGRVPAVMWMMARARDVRIDERALGEGLIRYVWTSPTGTSAKAWSELAERHHRSPQAMIAHYCLGIGALRDGRVEKASEHFGIARMHLGTHLARAEAREQTAWTKVFAPTESLPGEEFYRATLADVERIVWLMQVNRIEEERPADVKAFGEYMRLWPFRGASVEELESLARQPTAMADNFQLQAALAEPKDFARAEKLTELAGEVNDAAIRANYELGLLARRLERSPEWRVRKLKSAAEYFKVVTKAPENPYHAAATDHLAQLARRKEHRR